MLSGSLIKKVILPPGAVSLDDVDLDQVSVDYVLNCVRKGGMLSFVWTRNPNCCINWMFAYFIDVNNVGEMLELSEAIRDYHDGSEFPFMVR